jgi:hypothetical protein
MSSSEVWISDLWGSIYKAMDSGWLKIGLTESYLEVSAGVNGNIFGRDTYGNIKSIPNPERIYLKDASQGSTVGNWSASNAIMNFDSNDNRTYTNSENAAFWRASVALKSAT